MADMRAQFGVLGPVQLSIDGVAQPVGGLKQRAVLAYLLINANHPVSVDALAQAVWEQNPPSDVRVSLHTITSNLRKPLRAAGLDARALLAQVGAGYRISVTDGTCDVQRFRARKESGVRALSAGRFAAASESLSSALGQWRGPVLADVRGLGFADAYAAALDDEQSSAGARAELRDQLGEVYPLSGCVTRIGRLPDNDIVLEHGKVSRQHAVVVDNGLCFVIKDLWSSNGVYIDGVRIVDSVALRDGATVRIGDFEFVFTLIEQ
ncbi:FHA domain-containing protein [Nocardia sp. NBC_00565]|uniref:FHA domain-containing protein n=1 Tax=Nocardia sp. NBC_00565 TaxID=2975993 RepID=UPI002E81C223|nr:FHA domain-containing protein [Nocardia sp. NBC_00565]WUC06957.1 FHA domain-containing protein [Nocardia sp. NBC_00565]